jgi:hypothetical protein
VHRGIRDSNSPRPAHQVGTNHHDDDVAAAILSFLLWFRCRPGTTFAVSSMVDDETFVPPNGLGLSCTTTTTADRCFDRQVRCWIEKEHRRDHRPAEEEETMSQEQRQLPCRRRRLPMQRMRIQMMILHHHWFLRHPPPLSPVRTFVSTPNIFFSTFAILWPLL